MPLHSLFALLPKEHSAALRASGPLRLRLRALRGCMQWWGSFLLVASLACPAAHAQDSSPPPPPALRGQTPEARALALGHAGLLAFRKERFTEALSLFREAESLVHSPVFLLYQGRSAAKLGRLLEARETLRRCAREALSEGSPGTWRRAREDAEAELAELEARVPLLTLELRGEVQLPLELSAVDGTGTFVPVASRVTSARLVTVVVEADPGSMQLTLRDASESHRRVLWNAEAGQRKLRISTFLESPARQAAAAPSPELQGLSPERRSSPLRRGAWTALATGGSLLAAGLVAGGVAVERAVTLRGRCDDDVCRPEDEALKSDALLAARLAVAGVSGGAVALLTSGALFFWDAAEAERAGAAGWSVGLAPRALRLRYDF